MPAAVCSCNRVCRLDRKIELSTPQATKYQYLRLISEQIGYQFIYDSSLINNDETISIQPDTYTLHKLITIITGAKDVAVKVVSNHIALSIKPHAGSPDAHLTIKKTPQYTVITGIIFDLFSKDLITSATISINNAGIGTVSNQKGLFRLVVPDSLSENSIRVSHVGYENREFTLKDIDHNHIELSLEPKVIPLQEVVIRVINPVTAIQHMMEARKFNYSNHPVNLTAFYREGIEHKKKNIDLTEAVLQVYKTEYDDIASDQAKLIKMRRIVDRQEKDTILTKVKAGIYSALMLDMIKNVPDYLEASTVNGFDYTHADITVVDDRVVNVIAFEQKKGIYEPLFKGRLYIDTENHALLEAQVEINPEYVEKATSLYVEKKSRKIRLTLKKAAYTISYRRAANGIHYINHVRGDLEFKVRRRRKWFSSNLKVWFEMVNCKVETDHVQPIPRGERISQRTILSETPYPYDADFWGGMNIIAPENELKEFILKNLEQ